MSSPLFKLLLLLLLSILSISHRVEQPLLVNNKGPEAVQQPHQQQLTGQTPSPLVDASGNCVHCSTCTLSLSLKHLPYAGWTIKGGGVDGGKGGGEVEQCKDLSPKCADFAPLCAQPLYRLFLRSHCALTCGHCRPPVPQPSNPKPVVNIVVVGGPKKWKRNGRRVLASIKKATTTTVAGGTGEKGTTAKNCSTITTSTASSVQTESIITNNSIEVTSNSSTTITTSPTTAAGGKSVEETTQSHSSPTSYTYTSTISSPLPTATSTTISTVSSSVDPTTNVPTKATTEPSDCEDIGLTCEAMKAGCTDMGQRDILGTFCRRTCGFC